MREREGYRAVIDWTIYRDGSAIRIRDTDAHSAVCALPCVDSCVLPFKSKHEGRELLYADRSGHYADETQCLLVYKIDETTLECESVEELDMLTAVRAWVGATAERAASANAWTFGASEDLKRLERARVDGAQDMIASCVEAFTVVDFEAWAKLDASGAQWLRDTLAEHGRMLRQALGEAGCTALERSLSCVRSVELVGFGVGCPVVVLRSSFEDDPYAGPGVVIDVHPIETTRGAQYHSREVRMLNGSEVSVTCRRMREA